ncbi:hypothetical protein E4631_24210 [Hymenobacter sp. UV11]|nr:hypothetical protein E4631_24210 [Hymenobacter sp. UV11]
MEPAKVEAETYRDRNKIERFFGRLKQYRRLTTRYEKLSFLYWPFGTSPRPLIGCADCPHVLVLLWHR